MKAAEDHTESKTYEFGEYCLEAASLSLFREKKIIQLPPKTIEVLLALVESGGRVVSRDEITERVWAETFVEEANLTHHVSALRKTLGEDGDGRKFIETIPRRGYRFVAEVREIATGGAAEITVSERTMTRVVEEEIEIAAAPQLVENVVAQPTALETSALPKALAQKFKIRWRSLALAGTIALVALAGVGFALYKFANHVPMQFEAKKITRLTSSGRVKVAAVSPDGKFIIYSQEENGGQQSIWMQHIGSESSIQFVAPADNQYHGLKISPDGNSIFYVDAQGTLFRMPVLGGLPKKILSGVSTISSTFSGSYDISPDGKQIAYTRRFEKQVTALFTANADGTNERTVVSFEQPMRLLSTPPMWSPDGKIIACRNTSAAVPNILAVKVADGTFAPILPEGWSGVSGIAWLPDSKGLLAIGVNNGVRGIWQISYPGGEARQVNSDTNVYNGISLPSDGRSLATVREEREAYIWTMPSDDAGRARQLTTGFEKLDGMRGLAWLPDGKIIYNSSSGIWTVEPASGNPKQLSKTDLWTISPDGRYLIYQNGGLYRMDMSDGSEIQLTKGADVHATFSPDGKWVVYSRFGERVALWKVPIEGGEPTQVSPEGAVSPAVSPDGKTIAVVLRQGGTRNRIMLIPFDGNGEVTKAFDAVLEAIPGTNRQKLQWTPDGRGIYFIAFENGVSNIWQQSIDGSPPVQVTDFKEGRIFNFTFSPDGSQLALSRGTYNSDVVLIENQNKN